MRRRLLCLASALSAFAPQLRAARADSDCGLEDPRIARDAPAIAPRKGETALAAPPPVIRRQRMVPVSAVEHPSGGALAGKTVYVSPGHGFAYLPDIGWRTQRPNTHDLVEDFISAESVGYYLARDLRDMGAYVVPVREIDPSRHLVEVDDPDVTLEGDVAPKAASSGWGPPPMPLTGNENPFTSGESLVLDASSTQSGAVVWTFDVPEEGEYNVYAGYVQDPSRAPDAHYAVRHDGGESHFRVDQRRHGSTWVWLGRFYFERGRSAERGALVLYNDSAEDGATLSADVARLGGGVGIHDRGGGVSGRPMFETCARYYAQLAGAPPTVYDYAGADRQDDVGTRSRFAAWDHPDGEDAVYISWHSNAPSPARGTSSFAYGPNPYGSISEFSGVPGSLELMDAVHTEIVSDLRADWESDWADRGQHTAYFGEVNPNHNPEMPSILVEVAFHDTLEDANALREPRFRRLVARAMAEGIAKYFAARDGVDVDLPPEPPAEVRMLQAGPGSLSIAWRPPEGDPAGGDAPTGYRVYLSPDGLGFDEGTDVAGTELVLDVDPEAGPLYARVTAVNDGGESFPSQVVGARATDDGAAQVLLVGGFDRLDGRMLIDQDLSPYDLGTVQRAYIDRINDRSYLARYGRSVDASEVSFDSAGAGAVRSGAVSLDGYRAVLWQLGEDDRPLSAPARAALAAYVRGGGRLLVSGTDFARALSESESAEESGFLTDVLGASFSDDDAGTYGLNPGKGPFAGLGTLSFGDRGPGGYDAALPDVLEPVGGRVVFDYDGAPGRAAATWRTDGERVLLFGFPFEVIQGQKDRDAVMARILGAFGVKPDSAGSGSVWAGCACRAGGSAPSGLAGALLLLLLARVPLAPRRRPWKAAASHGDRSERKAG